MDVMHTVECLYETKINARLCVVTTEENAEMNAHVKARLQQLIRKLRNEWFEKSSSFSLQFPRRRLKLMMLLPLAKVYSSTALKPKWTHLYMLLLPKRGYSDLKKKRL
ncbi:unnamed protein product [Clavelina lepadiformis]|uniref:Uncharacterized protein n=1 Tax=Clavelina lepadiformis TaxID=159417 RepID=A0ABP0FXL1_CLALP